MMTEDFDRILDECVDRINRGDSVADCLSDYPAYLEELEPLLQSMRDVQKTCTITPLADTKRAARQKFYEALSKRRQRTPVFSFFTVVSRPAVWATVAVLLVAIAGTLVIRAVLNSPGLVPSHEGNFSFLIGDEPNSIGDFQHLNVTISGVTLRAEGSGEWLEFTPEIETVDLTQLQGGQFQEVWRGHVPAGQYSRVHIYVSEAKGKLEATGQIIDLMVPGGMVHVPIPFEVTVDRVTIYMFDITVVATGDAGKYMLKLQFNESGVSHE
jgi:hypothetical protein